MSITGAAPCAASRSGSINRNDIEKLLAAAGDKLVVRTLMRRVDGAPASAFPAYDIPDAGHGSHRRQRPPS